MTHARLQDQVVVATTATSLSLSSSGGFQSDVGDHAKVVTLRHQTANFSLL